MEKVDTVIIDMKGTLTEGRPSVTSILAVEGQDEREMLRLAAVVEQSSEHPIAAAIVKAAKAQKIELAKMMGFGAPSALCLTRLQNALASLKLRQMYC